MLVRELQETCQTGPAVWYSVSCSGQPVTMEGQYMSDRGQGLPLMVPSSTGIQKFAISVYGDSLYSPWLLAINGPIPN